MLQKLLAKFIKFLQGFQKTEAVLDIEGVNPGVTVKLPDGSAFFLASYPLPKDHWLYTPRQYSGDSVETSDFPKNLLLRPRPVYEPAVVEAARWAVRASTNCGKEPDFDPDAMVLNFVYALCGPNKSATAETKPFNL